MNEPRGGTVRGTGRNGMGKLADRELLGLYARQGSEGAFAELVRRYHGMVYRVCMRRLGDPFLAQDASQAVFLALSLKAGRIAADEKVVLAGWLFKAAAYAALNTSRVERAERRRMRERAAGRRVEEESNAPFLREMVPLLDTAIGRLEPEERTALFLRYLGGKSHAAVGAFLGISADAARMRVQRALKRLRRTLGRVDVTESLACAGSNLSFERSVSWSGSGDEGGAGHVWR